MKKLAFILLPISILLGLSLLNGCSETEEQKDETVAILKLGSHDIIDSVENAIKSQLRLKYKDNIEIHTYNANFDDTLLDQASRQIRDRGYSVSVPITTPASIFLANKLKPEQKMVFSFVTTPESIWGDTEKPKNITGTSDQLDYEKNIQLMLKIFPNIKMVGYLVNGSEENAREGLKKVKQLAIKYGINILEVNVSRPSDVANATRTVVLRSDAFLVGGDNTVVSALGSLLSIATKHKKPVFAVENTSVKEGCVAAYGVDYKELGNATSDMIVQILEGQEVESIDVNYFTKTKLYFNQKMADFYAIDLSKFNPDKVY